ncbi:MAG: hypothetical protein ACTSW1_08445 [Candidatus Hodarchaeales archaeon]
MNKIIATPTPKRDNEAHLRELRDCARTAWAARKDLLRVVKTGIISKDKYNRFMSEIVHDIFRKNVELPERHMMIRRNMLFLNSVKEEDKEALRDELIKKGYGEKKCVSVIVR